MGLSTLQAGRLVDIVTDVSLSLQAAYGQGPSNHRTWTQQEGGDLGYLPDWEELMPLQIGCSHEIASLNSSMTVDEANPDLEDFMARPPHVLPPWSLPLQCLSCKLKLSQFPCGSGIETLLLARPPRICSCQLD